MIVTLRTVAALLLTISPLLADPSTPPAPEKKKEPPRRVRFLPLGEAPPFHQEIRDGVRYELDPPAGSIPPREIVAGFGEKEKDAKEKPGPVRLNLGRISPPSAIPDGAGPLEIRQKDAAGDSKPWLALQRPEHGDLLVLIWRDPRGKSWDMTQALVLPDGPAAIGAGGVLLLNLSPYSIGAALGPEKLPLPYGKPIIKQPGSEGELPLDITALAADGKTPGKRLFSTALSINAAESTRVIAYRADGANPRTPVKVTVLREPLKPEE